MPAKQTTMTDEERAKRLRETARKLGTDDSPEAFDRAFKKVVRTKVICLQWVAAGFRKISL
jgi:hypothetical protein